jgi:hypothetical protein
MTGLPSEDKGLFDGLLFCSDHDCPMIKIEDSYICALDYIDELIGQRKITSFRIDKDSVSIVFDGVVVLPLLCPHCADGRPHIDEEKALNYTGLHLVSLSFDKDTNSFGMYFSEVEDGEPIEGAEIATKLDSIYKIQTTEKLL